MAHRVVDLVHSMASLAEWRRGLERYREAMTMPRKKASDTTTANGDAKPDVRSKQRKAIDRARSYIDRLRMLSRNGASNLEDAVELAQDGGADLDTEDFKALVNLMSEAEKLLLHLPTTAKMVNLIAESVPGKQTQDVLKT